jgi:predicted membrane protein
MSIRFMDSIVLWIIIYYLLKKGYIVLNFDPTSKNSLMSNNFDYLHEDTIFTPINLDIYFLYFFLLMGFIFFFKKYLSSWHKQEHEKKTKKNKTKKNKTLRRKKYKIILKNKSKNKSKKK